jgi:hypothetical protein
MADFFIELVISIILTPVCYLFVWGFFFPIACIVVTPYILIAGMFHRASYSLIVRSYYRGFFRSFVEFQNRLPLP